MPSDHATAASPGEAQADVAVDAVALAAVLSPRELIASLGIEAQIGIELERHAAGEFDPRRLVAQRHPDRAGGKTRRRVAAPVMPQIGASIGLPYPAVVAGMVHWPRSPSRPVVPEVEPSAIVPTPSPAASKSTCCQIICACGSRMKFGPSASGTG